MKNVEQLNFYGLFHTNLLYFPLCKTENVYYVHI
jgi:hypothetical protein